MFAEADFTPKQTVSLHKLPIAYCPCCRLLPMLPKVKDKTNKSDSHSCRIIYLLILNNINVNVTPKKNTILQQKNTTQT